ncbi:MAG: S41 family peptidase [Sphingomonas sp.]
MSRITAGIIMLSLVLAGCGGGDSGGGTATSGGTTTTPPTSNTCSLLDRQNWAFAQLNEWYLFAETLPASLSPTPYATVTDYIDALTATARGENRDRYFTYLTSIAQENAFLSSGSSAGFGIRIANDATARRSFVMEAFEGTTALAAGIDRGDEILAIGDTPTTLRNVSDIIAAEGTAGVTSALGPSTAGVTRTLHVSGPAGTRTLTVAKADYALTPVSSRYGAQVITDGGLRVGYFNLRTFISTADPALRAAFDSFRAQGITNFIIDFRYNGGGLVSTAELMGDLLGGNRTTSNIFSQTTYRTSKSSRNSVRRFAPASQSVSPVKIAFIGTAATASASEFVINAFIPYLGTNMALVGTNTYGKPVGQIALDRSACDDRLRVVAFSTRNSANSDSYFNGLATTVPVTCRAIDDYTQPLGTAAEASTRAALDFLQGQSCTAIAASGQTSAAVRSVPAASPLEMLTPLAPSPAQREVPGSF